MRIILAHGALGPLDELAYLTPEIIFVFSMILGWLRSRKTRSSIAPDVDESTIPSPVENESPLP